MGLLRSDIQNEINKAHLQIDALTTVIAKRYHRSQKYKSLADQVFKAMNYIKILQKDENLTDKEVEIFIQALRETLSLHEIAYQPTTLEFVYNQPALNITNQLEVSGTPSIIPRYNTAGNAFEDSNLFQSGNQLALNGSTFVLGTSDTSAPSRTLEASGSTPVAFTVKTEGDLFLQGNKVIVSNPLEASSTFKFVNDSVQIETIKDDSTFSVPSTTALVTEEAIDSRIDTEVATLNSSIAAVVKTAGSGLSEVSSAFNLGGSITTNALMPIGAGVTVSFTSPNNLADLVLVADTSAKLIGPSGSITSNLTTFQIADGILKYDIDRNGSYDARSVTDKNYQDNRIVGQPISGILVNPTGGQTGHSITWDGSQFTLTDVTGGSGSAGDADTLDGLDSSQFLRSDQSGTLTGILTISRAGQTGISGAIGLQTNIGSAATTAFFNVTREGGGTPTGVTFWSTDTNSYIQATASSFISTVTTGTAPMSVNSTTRVDNLNVQYLNGGQADQAASSTSIVQRSGSGGITVTSISGITNTGVVTNLNADTVDGIEGSVLVQNGSDQTLGVDFIFSDGSGVKLGDPTGLYMYHSGATYFDLGANNEPLQIRNTSGENIARFTGSQTELFFEGVEKFRTTTAGALVTGTITASNFIDQSDRRLKTEIKGITETNLALLEFVRPVSYRLKSEPERKQYGVIAQDLEDLLPELVLENNAGYKSVDYRSLSMLALAKIQEMDLRIKQLESKLNG